MKHNLISKNELSQIALRPNKEKKNLKEYYIILYIHIYVSTITNSIILRVFKFLFLEIICLFFFFIIFLSNFFINRIIYSHYLSKALSRYAVYELRGYDWRLSYFAFYSHDKSPISTYVLVAPTVLLDYY